MVTPRKSKKKPRPNRSTDMWKPKKKGESLAGEIVRMDIVNTQFGETPVVEIKNEDGEGIGVWCGAVLGQELYDEYDVGDEVEIVFKGWEDLEGGNRRKNFKVYDLNDDDDSEDDDSDE